MSTTDTVLLIVVTSLLSILFLVWISLSVLMIQIALAIKRVVVKAEEVADSVEEAAEIFKDTQGRLAFFKLMRNVIKVVKKRSK